MCGDLLGGYIAYVWGSVQYSICGDLLGGYIACVGICLI